MRLSLVRGDAHDELLLLVLLAADDLGDVLVDGAPGVVEGGRLQDDPGGAHWGEKGQLLPLFEGIFLSCLIFCRHTLYIFCACRRLICANIVNMNKKDLTINLLALSHKKARNAYICCGKDKVRSIRQNVQIFFFWGVSIRCAIQS